MIGAGWRLGGFDRLAWIVNPVLIEPTSIVNLVLVVGGFPSLKLPRPNRPHGRAHILEQATWPGPAPLFAQQEHPQNQAPGEAD